MASVDTIIFRINNTNNRYGTTLFNIIKNARDGKAFYKDEIDRINYETGEIYEPVNITEFMDMTTKKDMIFYRDTYSLDSYTAFSFYINPIRNFVEFNISIPKIKYGTNIIQDIIHIQQNFGKHMYNEMIDFEYQAKKSFTSVMKTIKKIITIVNPLSLLVTEQEFLNIEKSDNKNDIDKINQGLIISTKDIQLQRLDLCFNMLFENKPQALEYLAQLKRVKKPYQKNELGTDHYKSSIAFKTAKYYAKIYHKGTEFISKKRNEKKSDYNKLKEMNKKYKEKYQINKDSKDLYDLEKLQALADRTIRYEMEFKRKYISQLITQNFYGDELVEVKDKGVNKIVKKRKFCFDLVKRAKAKDKNLVDKYKKYTKEQMRELWKVQKNILNENIKKGIINSKNYRDGDILKDISKDYIVEKKDSEFTIRLKPFDYEYKKMSESIREKAKEYNFLLNTNYNICFNTTWREKQLLEKGYIYKSKESDKYDYQKDIQFDKDMFYVMVKEFKSFIKTFTLDNTQKLSSLDSKIKEYNENVIQINEIIGETKERKELKRLRRIKNLILLLKDYTKDEIIDLGLISRSTFYEIKKFCNDNFQINIEKKETDLLDWIIKINHENYLISTNKHFILKIFNK